MVVALGRYNLVKATALFVVPDSLGFASLGLLLFIVCYFEMMKIIFLQICFFV